MSLCQQPVESCSDVANPLGNTAMAGSQCLMTQLSPGVVIAVEEVVLFFNSFCAAHGSVGWYPAKACSLEEIITQRSFGAGQVVTVNSALELTAQEGFLLPSQSLPAVPNAASLVSAQCSSWRHSHCQPTHISKTGHTHLHPFFPLLIYHVLFLPRGPDPQSSHLPISAALLYQELMASSFSSTLCQVCHARKG